jgi:DNA polymerase-3 subunit gamma/tau
LAPVTAPSLFESDQSRDADQSAQTAGNSPAAGVQPSRPAAASLYRKYRPNSFSADELVGQDHIVRTLRNAVALDRVAHAYLFSGPRGTGKTTTARILAKAVNCLDPDPGSRPCNACVNCVAINSGSSPDVIEIDAASNRGIDDIRDLRDRVRYAPAQLRSKVYIIDEAHQITGAAANAFLKTLEEPPAHSRFILATTDPEELLPTIVSRCQNFEFRRVSADDMSRRLRTVAKEENIAISDDALRLVARHGTGSLRDALGILEQLSLHRGEATEAIELDDVRSLLCLSRN